MRPAGMTLHAKDSFPINCSSRRFLQVRRWSMVCKSVINSCFLSAVMLSSIRTESSKIPKNSSLVDGSVVFSKLMGTCNVLQTPISEEILWEHSGGIGSSKR